MRTRLSAILIATVLPLALAAACGYSPNPANGELRCGSSNTCPEGYSCMSGRCWKDGAAGSTGTAGSGGSSGRGGTTGTGGSSPADKFIGTWSFIAPSTRMISCTDGYTENKEWSGLGEMFTVMAGGGTPLKTHYYCDWDLNLASDTETLIKPGLSCSATNNDVTPPVTYTWHGMLFTLSTTNGGAGTLVAEIPYDYVSSAGTGSCMMHFTGSMSKN